ncbi:MAG: DUF2147 domain-containing protein [Pseudomonadales bacterium]|nr:DUF2147 domain-containing protein [Pseudomonadales bacterium]
MRFSFTLLMLLSICSLTLAESPVGRWLSVDDESGKVEALVEIIEVDNEVQGKIIDLIDPEEPNPKCEKCSGENENKPVIGLTIVWGLKESNGVWEGGYILDPKSGRTYKSRLYLNENGQLEVLGYIGFAALGRTQQWHRAEN